MEGLPVSSLTWILGRNPPVVSAFISGTVTYHELDVFTIIITELINGGCHRFLAEVGHGAI